MAPEELRGLQGFFENQENSDDSDDDDEDDDDGEWKELTRALRFLYMSMAGNAPKMQRADGAK